MIDNSNDAQAVAQEFIGTSAGLTRLGWGISGFVFLSPDRRHAIKVHRRAGSYFSELRAYRQLGFHRIHQVHGLTVPELIGQRDDLLCLQMDFVKPPFLLDFAGVLFQPPDYTPEVMAHWRQSIDEVFGEQSWVAHLVYHSLFRIGMYYMDFRPSNMNLKGWINPADSDRRQ